VTYRRSIHADAGGGTQVAFNRAGDRAAVAGWSSRVILCDFDTGRTLMMTPTGRHAAQFDADGRRLAAAIVPHDDKVGFWSVGDGRECRTLVHGRTPIIRPPAISSDGRVVAANFAEGLVLFDLATGRDLATVPFRATKYLGRVGSFEFDASGGLLTNSMDGCFQWPVHTDASTPGRMSVGPPERLPFHPGVASVSASRDGRVIAQAMWNGYGMQQHSGGWILPRTEESKPGRTAEPIRLMAGAAVGAASVSPDGRWVAFGVQGGSWVRVFDAETGRQVSEMDGGYRCQFTANGRWLVTDTDGNRLYEAGTWAPGPRLGPGTLACVSADSRLAVLGTSDGFFRLVEIATGRELARFDDPDHYAEWAAITPDGTRLLALARDGLRVWDLRAIRRELGTMGLDWDAPPFPPAPATEPVTDLRLVGAEFFDPFVIMW
jgi:WD40 repeat protein